MENKQQKSLLLVDDTPTNLTLMVEALKGKYQLKVATKGSQALVIANQTPPDLILLDVTMPEMDGYEVCKRLKENPVTSNIPVIFITARSDAEDETMGFELGAVDYIHKPFTPSILRARVKNHLELQSALQSAEEERTKADALLNVVLPTPVATELKLSGKVQARRVDHTAVVFCDVSGFTSYCDQKQPEEVVDHLHRLFVAFEEIAQKYKVEKIKTIGDCFMGVVGILESIENPLQLACMAAWEMCQITPQVVPAWSSRAGVFQGTVVAGIVGKERYQFDIWGDTVNMAARLCSAGIPGRVTISQAQYENIKTAQWTVQSMGAKALKGKGDVELLELSRDE
jgi:adenylate cyclase